MKAIQVAKIVSVGVCPAQASTAGSCSKAGMNQAHADVVCMQRNTFNKRKVFTHLKVLPIDWPLLQAWD